MEGPIGAEGEESEEEPSLNWESLHLMAQWKDGKPMYVEVVIESQQLKMELDTALRDIVSYAVSRVCPRHGMQIHIQTCTCADQYTYSYLDMSMSSAVCRWVLLGLSIGCVPHPYREQQFSP